jgi:hypothetical protein
MLEKWVVLNLSICPRWTQGPHYASRTPHYSKGVTKCKNWQFIYLFKKSQDPTNTMGKKEKENDDECFIF